MKKLKIIFLLLNKFYLQLFILTFLLSGLNSLYGRENSTELYLKAVNLVKNNKTGEAIIIFKKVIKLSPSYSLGYYGLGKAILIDGKEGNIEDAIGFLKRAVFLDKRFSKGYFYLGLAYSFKSDYKNAILSFRSAYEYDNSYIEALYNIGTMFEEMGDSFNSHDYYRKYFVAKEKSQNDYSPF